jgi:hypothetical protein
MGQTRFRRFAKARLRRDWLSRVVRGALPPIPARMFIIIPTVFDYNNHS